MASYKEIKSRYLKTSSTSTPNDDNPYDRLINKYRSRFKSPAQWNAEQANARDASRQVTDRVRADFERPQQYAEAWQKEIGDPAAANSAEMKAYVAEYAKKKNVRDTAVKDLTSGWRNYDQVTGETGIASKQAADQKQETVANKSNEPVSMENVNLNKKPGFNADKYLDKKMLSGYDSGYYDGGKADAWVPAIGKGALEMIRQTANRAERTLGTIAFATKPKQPEATADGKIKLTSLSDRFATPKEIRDYAAEAERMGNTVADKLLAKPLEQMRRFQDLDDEKFLTQAVAGALESAPQMAMMAVFADAPAVANMLMFNSSFGSAMEEVQKEHQAKIDAAKRSGDTAQAEALMNDDPLQSNRTWVRAIGSGALEVASERTFDLFAGMGGATKALQKAGVEGLETAVKTAGKSLVQAFTKEAKEKLFVPTVGNLLIYIAKKGAEEGFEEVVSEFGNGLIAKLTTNRNDKLFGDLITARGTALAFTSGALMGAAGSAANAYGQFTNTRGKLKEMSGLDIRDITPEHVKALVDVLNQDMENPANQQAVIEKAMQTVTAAQAEKAARTESVQVQGVEGPVTLIAEKTKDGQVELSLDGQPQRTVSAQAYEALKQKGTITQATPAVTATSQAVDDSNLPAQTALPNTAGANAQAQTAQGAGAAPPVASAYIGKNGKQVPVRSFVDGKTAVVEVSEPGTPVKHRIEFNPVEYANAENKAQFLLKASSQGKTADGRPKMWLGQMAKQFAKEGQYEAFYKSITDVADGITQGMAAQTAQKAAGQPQTAPKQTKRERAAEAEKTVTKATKGKESRDLTDGENNSVRMARDIVRESQKGIVDETVLAGLQEVDKDLEKKGISAFYNVTPDDKLTPAKRSVQKIVEDATGKRVVFVYAVGADEANEFVTNAAKDVLFVNSEKAVIPWAIGHGMYHLMVKDGTNTEFEQAALEAMGKTREQLIQETVALYRNPAQQEYLRSNPDAAFEEAIADRAGEVFATDEFWDKLNSQGTIGQKIMAKIKEWLAKIKKTYPVTTREVDSILSAIRKAEETVVAEKASPIDPILGIKGVTSIGPNKYIDVQFAVVDASSLIASHDLSGNENPYYDQALQPRDRSRTDSMLNINDIINNVDPVQLTGAESAKNGAPIISADGMVESGNGRVIGIKEFYRRGNESAKKYKAHLRQSASKYGIGLNAWPKNPVLVRIRLSDIDRQEFTRQANVNEQAAMSATEVAKSDAKLLSGSILSLFESNESGEINTAANRDFIREFIGKVVPSTERGTVIQEDGNVSAAGISRIRNALFYKAYGNLPLMDMVAESTDVNIKKILNAMVQAVPKIISVQEHIGNKTMFDMDIAQDLSAAAQKYATLIVNRKGGMDPVEEYVRQVKFPGEGMSPIAEDMLKILHVYRNSQKSLVGFLSEYYDGIGKLGNPSEQSLFGDSFVPDRNTYIDTLVEKELAKNGRTVEETESKADILPLFEHSAGTGATEAVYEEAGGPAESQEPAKEEVKPARLVRVEWRSKLDDAYDENEGIKTKRVSDWDNSVISESSGRDVVHLYWIEENGETKAYGIRSAAKKLGMREDTLGREMLKEQKRVDEENSRKRSLINQVIFALNDPAYLKPSLAEVALSWKKDAIKVHDVALIFEKDGKYVSVNKEWNGKYGVDVIQMAKDAGYTQVMPPSVKAEKLKAKTPAAKAKVAKAKAVQKTSTTDITDFGEKIGGARKDAWRDRGLMSSDLKYMNDMEASKYVKKDNIWKKVDYQAIHDSGVPKEVVYYIKTVRDGIPAAPVFLRSDKTNEQQAARREEYIQFVRSIQDYMMNVKTKEDTFKAFDDLLVKPGYYTKGKDGKYTVVASYEDFPHFSTKLINSIFMTERNWKHNIAEMGKAQFLVSEDKKLPKGIEIHLDDGKGYSATSKNIPGTYWISKGSMIIGRNFESEASAIAWVKEKFSDAGRGKDGKKRFVPRQLEAIHRTGRDYRNNNTKDATGDDYLERFKFRGGEFGNWVNQEERRVSLNYGFDALMDLSDALNIEPADISLGGKLAIAFGARGQGSAAAHFEPEREVINLTKMKGAGSLAHEWGHALDFMLGKALGLEGAMTESRTNKMPKTVLDLIRAMREKPMAAADLAEQQRKNIEKRKHYIRQRVTNLSSYAYKKMSQTQVDTFNVLLEKMESGKGEYARDFAFTDANSGDVKALSELLKSVTGRGLQKEERIDLSRDMWILDDAINKPAESATERSDFFTNSIKFDELNAREMGAGYWQSDIEMFARAFSTYVLDKMTAQEANSDYLTGHAEVHVDFDPKPDKVTGELKIIKAFPEGEERIRINAAFDALINDLKNRGLLHDKQATKEKYSVVQYSMRDDDTLTQETLDDGEQPLDKGMRAHKGNRAFTEEYLQKPTLELLTDAHKYYKVQGNIETIRNVAAEIDRNYRAAWARAHVIENVSPELTALRLYFMRRADLSGDYQEAADWAFIFNKSNKLAGQAVQINVILKKMSVEANLILAQRELLGAIDANKQAEIKEQAQGVAETLRKIDEGVSEYIFESVDDIMRVLNEPDLYERIKQYMSETGEVDHDPVKDFIEALHGVLSATKRFDKMPNTSDPVAFMKWVTANKDTLIEDITTAYEIMSNLSGDDPLTMAEIQAYFRGIMPPAIGTESSTEVTPELQAQINKALHSHFKEDIRTFNAMVRRLIDLGIDPADSMLIARQAQKQIARLTREEKLRAVRKLMPAGRRSEPFLIKLVNLSNQKGITENDLITFIAQAQGLPGMDPDMIRDIMDWSRQIENINEQANIEGRPLTREEERYQDIMMGNIRAKIGMAVNVKLGQKIDFVDSMFLMSTPKTSMRNIVGNLGFGIVDLGKDLVEAGIDGVIAKFSGKHMTGVPDGKALKEGFIRGIKESTYDITHGIYTAGINTGWDMPHGIILKSKVGQAATMVFRLAMEMPDRAFQTAYYESSLASQQRIHKTAEITDEMREVALYEAQRKTFADENLLTKNMGAFRRGANKLSTFGKSEHIGVGTLIVKFTHVTANLLMRTIDYSPKSFFQALYYLGKPIAENKLNRKGYWANFEQKKFTTALANGVYGSTVTIGLGILLTSLGIMTGRPEDDEDKRAALDAMGIGRGYMMNWSGLWRFLISGLDGQAAIPQPGDTWSTYSWFSPMNIGIGMGANIVQDLRDVKPEDEYKVTDYLTLMIKALGSGMGSIMEMSLLSGFKSFMQDVIYSQDPIQAIIKSTVDLPSRMVPNVIKSVREMTDNTYRNTYSRDLAVYAKNLLVNKIPGASKTLAPSVDMLGNLKEVYQANGNNLFNVFFNPANVYKYQPNEAAIFALSVMAQAEDEGVNSGRLMPEPVAETIKYKAVGEPVTLTDKERADLTSQIRKAAIAEWAKIPTDLSIDEKVKRMNNIQNDVAAVILKAYQAKKLAEKATQPKR